MLLKVSTRGSGRCDQSSMLPSKHLAEVASEVNWFNFSIISLLLVTRKDIFGWERIKDVGDMKRGIFWKRS